MLKSGIALFSPSKTIFSPIPKILNTIIFHSKTFFQNDFLEISMNRKWANADDEKKREIVLLTNHMEFGATTIGAIYKDRWQIELFFKAIKQNLKIKTFVGTSENALYIQIWTALIAMLLIKYLQFKAKFSWSLSNLVALLRWNLFTYRDLWKWLDKPFGEYQLEPIQIQYDLPFKGFGQHRNTIPT